MDKDFDQITQVSNDLRPKLREYLEQQGVQVSGDGFISCLRPDHADKNPSCSIGGKFGEEVFHCFSCGAAGNIFNAVHYLEGKPLTGVGFYEETLPYLCKKFNIPYEPIQISNEARDKYQKRCAVKDSMNVCHSMSFKGIELNTEHRAIKHLLDRGITEASIKKFKIGCISSHTDYVKKMTSTGYEDVDWLSRADLANKGIFNPFAIILPILDDKKRPVGFVSRTTKMKPNDKGQSKYVNSINSDIYHKSEILFNFHTYDPKNGPLWIVEGYLDAIYLDQCGLKNVCAIGATALTESHVDLLMRSGVKHINFCYDGDEGGRLGTKLAVERTSVYQVFKSIKIIELPEGADPDSYVRNNGLQALLDLGSPEVALSPFAWTLKHSTFQDDPIVIVEQAIPTIASEESNIKRLKMIKELSKITGIGQEDIRKDVDAIVNKDSSIFLDELTDINKYVQIALNRKKIKDTKNIIGEALIKIQNLERKFNNRIDNRITYDEKIDNLWDKLENGLYKYGLVTPKFRKFEEIFDGLPYNTCMTLIGGRPGAGKTTWATAVAIDVVEENPDAAVFYMSIDDTTELMTMKMLAAKTGFSTSKIKRMQSLSVDDRQVIRDARAWLNNLKKRFVMVDAGEGTTPEVMEAHIEWFLREYHDKKKIFLLDNFHKLKVPTANQKTDAISQLSEKIKELTRLYDIHIMMTVELRKMGENSSRPTPSDLKDSVQLEYDADVIIMAHNDKQVNQDTTIAWEGMYGDEGIKAMPFIEVTVHKNKMTGKTGGLAYKLNSYNLQIEEDSYSTIKSLKAKNAKSTFTIGK